MHKTIPTLLLVMLCSCRAFGFSAGGHRVIAENAYRSPLGKQRCRYANVEPLSPEEANRILRELVGPSLRESRYVVGSAEARRRRVMEKMTVGG